VDGPLGAVLAIASLILVKEAGLPIPVPGDLLVIGAGVAAGRGQLDPVTPFVLIVVGESILNAVGGLLEPLTIAGPRVRRDRRDRLVRPVSMPGPADRSDRGDRRLDRRLLSGLSRAGGRRADPTGPCQPLIGRGTAMRR